MKSTPSRTIDVKNFNWSCLGKLDAELLATLKHRMPRTWAIFEEQKNKYVLIINEDLDIVPIPNTQYYMEEKVWCDMTRLRYDVKKQQYLRTLFGGGKFSWVEIREDGCAYLIHGTMRQKLIHKDFTVQIPEMPFDIMK